MDKDGNKTGGRQKGTRNKTTQEVRELADRLGVNPLEILLHFASGNHQALDLPASKEIKVGPGVTIDEPTISPELRQKAAKDACEYLFPKLKSVEHSGDAATGEAMINLLQRLGAINSRD